MRERTIQRPDCTTKRLPVAPKDQGIWHSTRVQCPGCGKTVTAHPNGLLPQHRVPTA